MARLAERARKRAAPPDARARAPPALLAWLYRRAPRTAHRARRHTTRRPNACARHGAAAVPARRAAPCDAPRLGRGACAALRGPACRLGCVHCCGAWKHALRRCATPAGRQWLRGHRAAKPASPALRRLPIPPRLPCRPRRRHSWAFARRRWPRPLRRWVHAAARRAALRRGERPGGVAACHSKPNPDVARAFGLPDAARRRLRPCRGPRKVDHPRCSCGRRGDPQPEAVGDGADVRTLRFTQRVRLD